MKLIQTNWFNVLKKEQTSLCGDSYKWDVVKCAYHGVNFRGVRGSMRRMENDHK